MSNQNTHSRPGGTLEWMFLCSVLLSACGGGGPSSTAPDNQGLGQGALQLSGTIVVEERNGKTVFDGWFVQGTASDYPPLLGAGIDADDACAFDSVNMESVLAGAGSDSSGTWGGLQSINGHAAIESRTGEFESLVKQQIGDTAVYAPIERWKSEALPEDAMLSIESESSLAQIGGVAVPPLLPLVWLAPETGVMSSAAAELRWEASQNDEVRIKLKLSAIDFRDSDNPVVTSVDCNLIDDGQFTLPVNLQQLLPDDDMGIVVYAVRERVQQIQNDDASLTIVQLSYPAPVK